ncbi:DUF4148 domain-containing protein [Roseateles sp. P5_E11]
MFKRILVVAVAAAAFTVAASAQAADNPSVPRSTTQSFKTRAEVIADLEIYLQSGLQHLDRRENVDADSPAYAAAQQRYQQLRQSPKYAELVRAHAARFGETVDVAGIGTAQRTGTVQ